MSHFADNKNSFPLSLFSQLQANIQLCFKQKLSTANSFLWRVLKHDVIPFIVPSLSNECPVVYKRVFCSKQKMKKRRRNNDRTMFVLLQWKWYCLRISNTDQRIELDSDHPFARSVWM